MLRKGLAIVALGLALSGGSAFAAGTQKEPRTVAWSFNGPFGKFDRAQLQRGFKVYREVCAACHSMDLMSFRNLGQNRIVFSGNSRDVVLEVLDPGLHLDTVQAGSRSKLVSVLAERVLRSSVLGWSWA